MALTDEQREALWNADGSPARDYRIVSARAGTGKTTMLTEYCIDLAQNWTLEHEPWQGMAVLSYTNVAKDELEARIQRLGRGGGLLSAPHFVGTIDAFTNQYLFLPFGAAQMGCVGRPRLVGEPYNQWRASASLRAGVPREASSPVFFDCYGLTATGTPIVVDTQPRMVSYNQARSAERPSSANSAKIASMKRYVWEQGFATQNDANYLALRVLANSASLTSSFIRRFPVLVVDEAQDMTEVQHALLDHLRAAGHKHIVLVGDEYQAIYEWNTARPQLFTAKRGDEGWNPRTVSETFRCSPAICTVLGSMAPGATAIEPAIDGKNRHYDEPVQVHEYDPADEWPDVLRPIHDMAKMLAERGAHDGTDVRTIAVLARSGAQVASLQTYFTGETPRQTRPATWEYRYTKDFLRIVYHLLRRDLYAAANAYETMLLGLAGFDHKADLRVELARRWGVDSGNPFGYRAVLFDDLSAIRRVLPDVSDIAISRCSSLCRVTLNGIGADVLRDIGRDCGGFAGPKHGQDQQLSAVFAAKETRLYFQHQSFPNVRLVFSTVHGTKGETYDGIIFYTKEKLNGCGCSQSSSNMWSKILRHSLIQCENKRIAYVALSRAAQVLFILAPASSATAWRSLL